MAVPASTEIQGIPTGENTKIVHLPTQETEWRKKVAQHVRNIPEIGPSFTEKEATPYATQPIPKSEDLEQVGAERVGAESELPISISDMKHHLETAGTIFGGEDDQTHIRTTKGKTPISMLKRRLFGKAA